MQTKLVVVKRRSRGALERQLHRSPVVAAAGNAASFLLVPFVLPQKRTGAAGEETFPAENGRSLHRAVSDLALRTILGGVDGALTAVVNRRNAGVPSVVPMSRRGGGGTRTILMLLRSAVFIFV